MIASPQSLELRSARLDDRSLGDDRNQPLDAQLGRLFDEPIKSITLGNGRRQRERKWGTTLGQRRSPTARRWAQSLSTLTTSSPGCVPLAVKELDKIADPEPAYATQVPGFPGCQPQHAVVRRIGAVKPKQTRGFSRTGQRLSLIVSDRRGKGRRSFEPVVSGRHCTDRLRTFEPRARRMWMRHWGLSQDPFAECRFILCFPSVSRRSGCTTGSAPSIRHNRERFSRGRPAWERRRFFAGLSRGKEPASTICLRRAARRDGTPFVHPAR